jgi:ABC-type branched-subunit amino acid transport system substrate-binding protein
MAYFEKVNAAGGVNGRKIKLISYDDGYEPEQTAAMTRKLIEQDKLRVVWLCQHPHLGGDHPVCHPNGCSLYRAVH